MESTNTSKGEDSLHVAFQLVHSAFVQVAAEEREQVWGQEERLHQWTLGQLTGHLEDAVRPNNSQTNISMLKKRGALKMSVPGLKVPDAGL